MNFGQTIEELKKGECATRLGWSGNNMFIYLVRGRLVDKDRLMNEAYQHLKDCDTCGDSTGSVVINGHIDMKAEDGSVIVGWTPSQIDMLADDWVIV